MERALARWPWPQLLRRTGAPTRESPHQVLSSAMTSPLTSSSSRPTSRCPAAAKVLAAHLHLCYRGQQEHRSSNPTSIPSSHWQRPPPRTRTTEAEEDQN